MKLTFNDEAYETFQKLVSALAGYTVEITIDGEGEFDATLVGPDHDSEWGDAVLVQRHDEDGEAEDEIESVRAAEIYVY